MCRFQRKVSRFQSSFQSRFQSSIILILACILACAASISRGQSNSTDSMYPTGLSTEGRAARATTPYSEKPRNVDITGGTYIDATHTQPNRVSLDIDIIDLEAAFSAHGFPTSLDIEVTAPLAVSRDGARVGIGMAGLDGLTAGDLLFGFLADTFARLPIGAPGQFLGNFGGLPVWLAITANDLPTLDELNGILDLSSGGTGAALTGASNGVLQLAQDAVAVTVAQLGFSQLSGAATDLQLSAEAQDAIAKRHSQNTDTGTDATTFTAVNLEGVNVALAGWLSASALYGPLWGDSWGTHTGAVIGDASAATGITFAQIGGQATAQQVPALSDLTGTLQDTQLTENAQSALALQHAQNTDTGTNATTYTAVNIEGQNVALTGWIAAETLYGPLWGDTWGTHTGNVAGDTTGTHTGDSYGTHHGAVVGDASGATGITFTQIGGQATANQVPALDALNGILDITSGGTGVSMAATGGAGKVLKQITAGANVTVAQVDFTELTGAAVASQVPALQDMTGTLDLASGGTGTGLIGVADGVLQLAVDDTQVFISQLGFAQLSGQATASQVPMLQDMSGTLDLLNGGTGSALVGVANGVLQLGSGATGASVAQLAFSQLSGAATASQVPALQDMSGTLDVGSGGTGASLTATGGTGKVLKQTSVGGVVTVANVDFTELTGVATSSQVPALSGLSGALLDSQLSAEAQAALGQAHAQNTDTGSDAATFTVNDLVATGGTFTGAPWFASGSDVVEDISLFTLGNDFGGNYYNLPFRFRWQGSSDAYGMDRGITGEWLNVIANYYFGNGAYLTGLTFPQLGGNATVPQGGTGLTSLPANSLITGNGTSAVNTVAVNATATPKYLHSVSTSGSGAPEWRQTAFSDLSGAATVAQMPQVARVLTVSGTAGTAMYTTVQAAIDAIPSARANPELTPYVVDIGPGRYNETVDVNEAWVTLRGAGRDATVIWYSTVGDTYSAVGNGNFPLQVSATNCAVEHLSITNAATGTFGPCMIVGAATSAPSFRAFDCNFESVNETTARDAVWVLSGADGFEMINCSITSNQDCFAIQDTNGFIVDGLNITAYDAAGLWISNCTNGLLRNISITYLTSNSPQGAVCDGTNTLLIDNLRTKSTGTLLVGAAGHTATTAEITGCVYRTVSSGTGLFTITQTSPVGSDQTDIDCSRYIVGTAVGCLVQFDGWDSTKNRPYASKLQAITGKTIGVVASTYDTGASLRVRTSGIVDILVASGTSAGARIYAGTTATGSTSYQYAQSTPPTDNNAITVGTCLVENISGSVSLRKCLLQPGMIYNP